MFEHEDNSSNEKDYLRAQLQFKRFRLETQGRIGSILLKQ